MLKARFRNGEGLETGEVVGEEIEFDGESLHVDSVDVQPPSDPSKVVCVGKNYRDHARELDTTVPDFPLLFLKPPSSVIGAFDEIIYPDSTVNLHYEGELALVIGEDCRGVEESDALDYVAGYTCLNDVTARDWQDRENQWTRAKGMDTFCPIGPYLQTDLSEIGDRDVITRVNGEEVQRSNTQKMVFSPRELVSEVSEYMTLREGDILATGTPEGVGALERGDVVGVEVEGAGTLLNEVV
ncbi:MAG: fumarylacetoacetate hydrolase family protein [Halobacteria archaeon]